MHDYLILRSTLGGAGSTSLAPTKLWLGPVYPRCLASYPRVLEYEVTHSPSHTNESSHFDSFLLPPTYFVPASIYYQPLLDQHLPRQYFTSLFSLSFFHRFLSIFVIFPTLWLLFRSFFRRPCVDNLEHSTQITLPRSHLRVCSFDLSLFHPHTTHNSQHGVPISGQLWISYPPHSSHPQCLAGAAGIQRISWHATSICEPCN